MKPFLVSIIATFLLFAGCTTNEQADKKTELSEARKNGMILGGAMATGTVHDGMPKEVLTEPEDPKEKEEWKRGVAEAMILGGLLDSNEKPNDSRHSESNQTQVATP